MYGFSMNISKVHQLISKFRMQSKIRLLLGISVILLSMLLLKHFLFLDNKQTTTYETTVVTKGTLISTVSGSGTITSGNNTTIITKASGTVTNVYVKNGDIVKKNQKLAEVKLDEYALDRQATTWKAYLDATEDVKTAEKNKASADIQMWQAREAWLNAQDDASPNEGETEGERAIINKTVEETKLAFAEAELRYKNATSEISAARAKAVAELKNYQENAATIIAPTDGVVSDLVLAQGMLISASSTTSSTSGSTIVSAQTIGKINQPNEQVLASISVSEIDVLKLKSDQKVTLTLDAYSDKSFTGKVLSINTNGTISSGVTSYPVTILLDSSNEIMYPNMAVSAQVITNVISNSLLVPSSAITTTENVSSVQILRDGKPTLVDVTTGASNDTQTIILSGLSEGDQLVTSVLPAATSSDQNTNTSPFSGLGRTNSNSSLNRNSGNMMRLEGPPGQF